MIFGGIFFFTMENNEALKMFENTVKYSGDVIFIQPFCDFFGIDHTNQLKVINKSPLLKKWASKKTSMLLFNDNFQRIALTKQGFIAWILQINCQIVQEDLREKLIEYQSLIFEFMFGSMQREDKTKLMYARLKKLKKLKGKINAEIKNCENQVQGYLSYKFTQTTLLLN
jgi:hypothetical protein